jgi:hypothetical protein
MADNNLIQVGGLWKNTSANGEMYLQGKLGPNVRILIFKNKYKTEGNQPDYIMNFAPVERRAENQAGPSDDEFLSASPDELLGNGAPAHDPAFEEGKSAHTAPAPATMRGAPDHARPRPASMPAQAARPAPAPPARPAPAHARPPMRRSTPEPDYDDMGDMADPFAE